ncbi:MAG: beta-glucanase (GH16 family) [Crocinitomicaceae bacterium]|jgi:beta-glucanase (GH16 family)
MNKKVALFVGGVFLGLSSFGQGDYPPNLDPMSWNKILSEEFDTDFDHTKWFGQGETINDLTHFQNLSNISVSGGKLNLKLVDYGAAGTNGVRFGGSKFRSGQALGTNSGNYLYGYFEFAATVPTGEGFYSALWLSVKNGPLATKTWPPEIDLLEMRGDEDYDFIGTTHCYNTGWDKNDEYFKAIDHVHYTNSNGDALNEAEFIYGLDWFESNIGWYLDEELKYDYTAGCISEDPLSIVISLKADDLGGTGNFINIPPIGQTGYMPGQALEINYVRVYKKNWHYSDWNNAAGSGVVGNLAANHAGDLVVYRASGKSAPLRGMEWNGSTWVYTTLNGAGSGVASDIVISSNDTDIFFRGTNGAVKGITKSGSNWISTTWNNAAPSGVAGDIVVNAAGNQVYYRTTGGGIKGMYKSGSNWYYTNCNNAVTAGVASDLVISPDGLHIYYKTTSGGLASMYWAGSAWAYSNLGNVVTSGVAGDLVINSDGLKIFYRNTGGAIKGIYWNGSAFAYTDWGAIVSSGVAGDLTINSDDVVFYRTTAGAVSSMYYESGSWYNGALNNVAPSGVAGNITIGVDQVFYKNTSSAIKGFYYKEITDPLLNARVITPGSLTDLDNSISFDETVEFNVYPNPNNGVFHVEFTPELDAADSKIEIVNSEGAVLKVQYTSKAKTDIDVSTFGSGIYFVRLITKDGMNVKGVVIE